MQTNDLDNDGPHLSPEDMIREACKLPGAEFPADFHLYSGLFLTICRGPAPRYRPVATVN